MSRSTTSRKYGKARRTRAQELFAELPRSPVKKADPDDLMSQLTAQLTCVTLEDQPSACSKEPSAVVVEVQSPEPAEENTAEDATTPSPTLQDGLRVLTWDDVCPFGDRIEKIAEASYAEVYRVTNERGVSIIKTIRLRSPLRPQTKVQEKARLVDEEPHSEDDLAGELRISELVADIPGFVVYKERYLVRGRGSKALLETHQSFHRRAKRKESDRLQFYPSPSRYLDETVFLVVELGDAGTALEDFPLVSVDQLWDIFLHTAVALARAEDLIKFEHRDLHEGNLCIRQPSERRNRDGRDGLRQFGYSGLDITILDYGLSRAEDLDTSTAQQVAYDLERDLSIFTSTHAPHCKVYRQMRSFLLKGDRWHLPPEAHTKPYENGPDGQPISWGAYHPYTNVLWLAYVYAYLTEHFRGGDRTQQQLKSFRRATRELWAHLDPDAPLSVLSFSSAGDVVRYAVEAGWIPAEQLLGERSGIVDGGEGEDEDDVSGSVAFNESIIESRDEADESHLRRSPRRRQQRVL